MTQYFLGLTFLWTKILFDWSNVVPHVTSAYRVSSLPEHRLASYLADNKLATGYWEASISLSELGSAQPQLVENYF